MTGKGMRAVGIAATVAAVVAVGGAAPVSADGGAKTQITIKKLTHSGASGVITSGSAKCDGGGRRVQFFGMDGYISVKIQKTMTDASGRWKISRDLAPGKYFAKIDSSPGCRYDNSKFESLK